MATPENPRVPIYEPGWAAWIGRIAGVIAGGALIRTLWLVLDVWSKGPRPDHVYTIYVLAALWAVLPPIWFWFEYFFVYRVKGRDGTFELFKHGQQTSIAIWAGVTLSLVAFASSEYFKATKPETTKVECKCAP